MQTNQLNERCIYALYDFATYFDSPFSYINAAKTSFITRFLVRSFFRSTLIAQIQYLKVQEMLD